MIFKRMERRLKSSSQMGYFPQNQISTRQMQISLEILPASSQAAEL